VQIPEPEVGLARSAGSWHTATQQLSLAVGAGGSGRGSPGLEV
jgi:hypothetical protein